MTTEKPQDQASTTPEQDQETTANSQAQEQGTEIEERLAALEERYKKEIAGLNSRNSKLENELKAKEREQLDEVERTKAEMQDALEEKTRIENEAKTLRRQLDVDKAIMSAGLPQEFAKRIHGDTPKEIEADVKEFHKFLDDTVNARIEEEIKKRLAGKPPTGSTPSGNKTVNLAEFKAMPPKERYGFMKSGGDIVEE